MRKRTFTGVGLDYVDVRATMGGSHHFCGAACCD